jgi:predicted nucleotidyltransferase
MNEHTSLSFIKEKLHQEFPLLTKLYKVKSLGVFGSYVHQEQGADSDIDILVTFMETPSLLKFIELENYLTDLLEIKVDLVMRDALKPRIGERILREVVPI